MIFGVRILSTTALNDKRAGRSAALQAAEHLHRVRYCIDSVLTERLDFWSKQRVRPSYPFFWYNVWGPDQSMTITLFITMSVLMVTMFLHKLSGAFQEAMIDKCCRDGCFAV